ncbi:ABC transporter ATP-binding protein [Haloarchaeobius sp. HRN-SO-5]|uniref:ABC transporter ATP-binding protein n=1 Tax=Haloarchaeobius sp. HRN-SO-5 TaxID=3446118 RepID=UPI003EBD9A85
MARVTVENLTKEFDVGPDIEVAVDDISFTAQQGEFVTIVGPSGCGKTTLLRCISGLESPTSGSIKFDEREVTNVIPQRRGVSMVFQNIAIYSHMTAAENIVYPLKIQTVSQDERDRRLHEAADMLQIEQYLNKHPPELSGGQQQRVALARSLVQQPNVFLFDEPTSNLDAKLKVEIRKEIQKVAQETDQTMVYVTHDQEEAMTMSDKVVVMNDGDIMQVGSPDEIYNRPDNVFVAGFMGTPSMNLLDSEKRDGSVSVTEMGQVPTVDAGAVPDGTVTIGFRPETVELTTAQDGHLTGEVQVVESLGHDRIVYLNTPQGEVRVVTEEPRSSIIEGERRGLELDPAELRYFDAETGERIRTGRERTENVATDSDGT